MSQKNVTFISKSIKNELKMVLLLLFRVTIQIEIILVNLRATMGHYFTIIQHQFSCIPKTKLQPRTIRL